MVEDTAFENNGLGRSKSINPLPDPETIRKYEEVLPGSAERLIRLAEQQAEHIYSLDITYIRQEARINILGMAFGFVFGIACILISVWLVYLNMIAPAMFLLGASLWTISSSTFIGLNNLKKRGINSKSRNH